MQLFENIVGNNKIKESLKNAVKSNNVSHSYLFIGKAGVGKKLFAKDLAKKVMCLGSNYDAQDNVLRSARDNKEKVESELLCNKNVTIL